MPTTTPGPLILSLLLLLGACGGDRERTLPATVLDSPSTTVADAEHCSRADDGAALLGWRSDGQTCRRAFRGLAATVPGPTEAAALPRVVSVTELFDWAEVRYRDLFPSHRDNQSLEPYTYRYYPETGNHVAVAGDQIYVQGPLSGGALLYVGTLAEYTCTVSPDACAGVQPCTAPASWAVAGSTCTPNEGQPKQIASGSNYTFVDSTGASRGQASHSCSNGSLTLLQPAQCEPLPAIACNTHVLTWSENGTQCRPNGGEPTQLDAGSSHSFQASGSTVGSATFTCDGGLLVASGPARCSVASGSACSGTAVSWLVDGRTCHADNATASVANGGRYAFYDATGSNTGTASFVCNAGVLQVEAGAVCSDGTRVSDSFGGDGGAADGGASGDGTAADGAPIVGGLVRVYDLSGRSASAITDRQGYFRLRLTGMTPPLLVTVTRPDGKMRRSLSLRPLRSNGFVFIAVTGLTDKIVSDVAAQAGLNGAAAVTPALIDRLRSAVDTAVTALRLNPVVRTRLQAAGIDPARFDPLHTPFRPDGTGYDAVLDNLLVDTDDTGSTVVRSADCTTPASWTVDGVTCTPDAGTPEQIGSGTTLVLRDTSGNTRGAVGYGCSKGVLSRPLLPSCSLADR